MLRTILKSKVHRAIVTEADLEYEGSLTLDQDLMGAADLLPYELVQIYNITNGERLETYLMEGESGSGIVCVNGAAARKVSVGDKIIIASYVSMESREAKGYQPKIVLVDEKNRAAMLSVKGKFRPVNNKNNKKEKKGDSWLLEP